MTVLADRPVVSDPRLTPPLIEVLDLVAEGLPNHEIARRLGLKPDTVATRLKVAAKALGSGDRTTMVAECYRRGIFQARQIEGEVPVVGAHLLPLLSLLARGRSYAECAVALGIDESLVKKRAPVLYRLVGAVDRTNLPRRAVDCRLLPLDLVLPGMEPTAADVPPPAPALLLSPAQERALRLFAHGLDGAGVAMRLRVSEGAVREVTREAMALLGARTLPHAVLLACQAGILPGGAS